MRNVAPKSPHPSPSSVQFGGRRYPLLWEPSGWRLRSKAKSHPADYRTGTTNLRVAQEHAREWLKRHADDAITSRKGGGTLAALVKLYEGAPKRTKAEVGKNNVSRLRVICRLTLGRELEQITCREITSDFWQQYQKAALEKAGRSFDLVTRYRENISINAAVRAARSIFLPGLIRVYRSAGLDVHRDAGAATMLPVPYLPPTSVDDSDLLRAWEELKNSDERLWLVIGLARFAGLRREEIANCRAGWIEERDGAVTVSLRDRPEEDWWSKTGRPYRAQVINPDFAEWLNAAAAGPKDRLLVQDPPQGEDRARWFERVPQAWLKAHGITSLKPLHRLRGLYADHVAKITSDAVTARLAAVRAAQQSLGHTTSAVTEKHYLSET